MNLNGARLLVVAGVAIVIGVAIALIVYVALVAGVIFVALAGTGTLLAYREKRRLRSAARHPPERIDRP